jgi:hypothetical protein
MTDARVTLRSHVAKEFDDKDEKGYSCRGKRGFKADCVKGRNKRRAARSIRANFASRMLKLCSRVLNRINEVRGNRSLTLARG